MTILNHIILLRINNLLHYSPNNNCSSKMNIKVTTFTNPFSFFCFVDDNVSNNALVLEDKCEVISLGNKVKSNERHGQYVAVFWNNKWVRGVVWMESQFLIWLVDYGIYIRPNENQVYKDLPSEYKKTPTKVFEASIHGVVPVDKSWLWFKGDCTLDNSISTTWTPAAIETAWRLIKDSLNTYFKPVALLTTRHNDVILGDLYIETPEKGLVNLINELKLWPIFLQVNKKTYIKMINLIDALKLSPVFLEESKQAYLENMANYYVTRRHHHACYLKPNIPGHDIPTIKINTSLEEYSYIIAKSPPIEDYFDNESALDAASTVVSEYRKDKSNYKITPEDMEMYSKRFITLNGREYNVLNILINKTRDLNLCEKYKDYDLKYIGRGFSFRCSEL